MPDTPVTTSPPPGAEDAGDVRAGRRKGASRTSRASRRPRETEGADSGRQFVAALARGLDVLSAFRVSDGPLGNQELAERTGLPKPTVSRITHTLMELGYLSYNPRLANYELGGRTLKLAFTALERLDIRRVARPLMQELANAGDMNISLTVRERQSVICIETCEGSALIGLRLPVGARMPIATTSAGKAWLAGATPEERAAVLEELRRQKPEDFPKLKAAVDAAVAEIREKGYCTSIGEWQRDINGAGAPIILPDGRGVYALGLGGPAYLLGEKEIHERFGPMLARTARAIADQLGGVTRPPA
ncbi:IclR family transcriptional regulator [Camelimonas abortus]|uniref:IclR family transcriptional regulator n=1 Tax=Camelimonas abortus TaxID=1017184 RepID=A0ABV7LBF3_9HYPH